MGGRMGDLATLSTLELGVGVLRTGDAEEHRAQQVALAARRLLKSESVRSLAPREGGAWNGRQLGRGAAEPRRHRGVSSCSQLHYVCNMFTRAWWEP